MAARNRPRVRTDSSTSCPSGPEEGAERSISTLFCPDCGHESGVDGDWTVVETARTRRYLCPDCGTEITARPTDGVGHERGRG